MALGSHTEEHEVERSAAERAAVSRAQLPHVVIVGGGFGGMAAARALRNAPARVTVLDRRNHHLFQPLLYQVATSVLGPGEIASPIRQLLRKQRNTTVGLLEVTGIDVEGRRVLVDCVGDEVKSLAYDYLVL